MADTIGDNATAYFKSGYSCSEAVLIALSKQFGEHSNMIPRIASGFGGGMGRCGLTCGAISGAVMGLAMRFGRMRPEESRDRLYSLVQKLEARFREQFGDTVCRNLIGYDMRTPDGLAAARASGVFESKCRLFVREAAITAAGLANAETSDMD
jgi:C_GCAxxG_C_C family probable redox protein